MTVKKFYMDTIVVMQLFSGTLRNFDNLDNGNGAKLRLKVLQDFIMDAAKAKPLSKRNAEEREYHAAGRRPLLLVPPKSGTTPTEYFVWDRNFCAPKKSKKGGGDKVLKCKLLSELKKALIKEEIGLLLKPKVKEAKEKIKTNWDYAFKIAIEWFYKHCRGEAVADENKKSIFSRKSSKLKQPKKVYKEVADAIKFIEKCLLRLERNKKETLTSEGQKLGENYILVEGIFLQYIYIKIQVYFYNIDLYSIDDDEAFEQRVFTPYASDVEIKASNIPKAGVGVFGKKDFEVDEVWLVYGDREFSDSEWCNESKKCVKCKGVPKEL